MPLRISRFIALLTGVLLPAIETWRRWNMFGDWSAWLDDYIAGALLLFAWYAGRTQPTRSRPYLLAAWGYLLGIAYVSFFSHLKSPLSADPSGFPRAAVLAVKAFGICLAAAGLASVWKEQPDTSAPRHPPAGDLLP